MSTDAAPAGPVIKHEPRLLEEAARLAEDALAPGDYYSALLFLARRHLKAPGGAGWGVAADGALTLWAEFGRAGVPLDHGDAGQAEHAKLLQAAAARGQPVVLSMPWPATAQPQPAVPVEPSPLVLAPVIVQGAVAGLLEVWLAAGSPVSFQQEAARLVVALAGYASAYAVGYKERQLAEERKLWSDFEGFARQVHASLDPTAVAYVAANEGRRLTGVDRLAVAHRLGNRARVAAVSGAVLVEVKSNLLRSLAALSDAVLDWNEPLIHAGVRDDTLPPAVLSALDAYLDESNSKLLVAAPVRDVREKDETKPCRSVLVAECFEPSVSPDALRERLDTVGNHAAPALYNALEYHDIPLRWLWKPVVLLRRGLGERAGLVAGVAAGLLLLVALALVPFPLRLDAKGQLLPKSRSWLYPTAPGHVVRFAAEPGARVSKGQNIVLMYDHDLELRLVELTQEAEAAEREIQAAAARAESLRGNDADRRGLGIERRRQEAVRDLKLRERDRLRDLTNAEESRPGNFWLKSPRSGTVLSFDFQEQLLGRFVRPSDPLLRIGDQVGAWEVELRLPQKHIGRVLQSFGDRAARELDADVLLLSAPTHSYAARLARDQIAGEALARPDGPAAEPAVPMILRIDGDDLPQPRRVPPVLLVSGTEVHARIHCGYQPLGYVVLYGAWEFLCEKLFYYL